MPAIRTGYSCPTCKNTTGDVKEIIAEGRRLICSYRAEHTWNDSQDFLDLKPTIDFKMAPQAAALAGRSYKPERVASGQRPECYTGKVSREATVHGRRTIGNDGRGRDNDCRQERC